MAAHPNVRTLRSLEQSLSKGLALFLMADRFTEFHSTTFGPIISFFETSLAPRTRLFNFSTTFNVTMKTCQIFNQTFYPIPKSENLLTRCKITVNICKVIVIPTVSFFLKGPDLTT